MKTTNWMPRHLGLPLLVLWCAVAGLLLPSAEAGTSTAMSPVFAVDLTGQPPPDVAVENVRFSPASASIGGAVNVSFRVRNLSGRAAVSPVARVRLTSDSALTESDPGLLPLDVTLPTLTAGTAYDYSGSFNTAVGSLLPGAYFVAVRLDPLNQLGQANTANDVALSPTKLSVLGTGGPSLVVLPATRTISAEASVASFSVYNAGGGTMAWTASVSAAPWLHLGSGSAAGSGPGTIVVSCDANTTTSSRTGTITIAAPGATPASVGVSVTQAGAGAPQPPVTALQFSSIPTPQNVNSPFAVTLQALNGAVVQTGFNGEVQLAVESGGNVSLRSVRLVNGAWSGSVSLDTVATQTRLIATTTDSKHTQGQSNPFQVQGAATPTISVSIKVVEFMTVPVSSAAVLLGREGETPTQAKTDSQGLALFSVAGAGRYNVTAQKLGYNPATGLVEVSGKPVSKTIEMHSFRPPVILVPGMMGSCSEVEGTYYPLLHRGYPAQQSSLKLFHPYVDKVGWNTIRNRLFAAGFEVYEAPWDWRMPVIKADDNGKVAWREYLLPVIARVKAETGAQKVDIVAHSMGGLLTRAYIQSAEYAGDIGRFAMVGTPNEGSAKAYYLWFGGDAALDWFYEGTSKLNYKEWTGGDWNALKASEKLQFYRQSIKSLEELLPVYANPLALGDLHGNYLEMNYPGVESNPLYTLDHGLFANLMPPCTTGKVCTKVFYSTSEQTVRQIRLTPSCSAGGVYPHGTPAGEVKTSGDGTVTGQSAAMTTEPFPTLQFPSGGEHSALVGSCSAAIRDFLLEGRALASNASSKSSDPAIALQTNQLLIAVAGRSQPWITDPVSLGAGISPGTGVYINGWGQAVVEVEAGSAMLLRDNPPAGNYLGYLTTFPGERIGLSVASSLGMANALGKDLQWIGTTNEIRFNLQLGSSGSNALVLVTELPAPQNVWSFGGGGLCALAWDALTNANVAAYRVYARRQDESLFALLGTVTNPPFSTGHPWAAASSETNWFYAVVAVSTNGTESPYQDTVANYVPTLAKFSAGCTSGTPPLSVAFTDLSTGGVTNWSWDFNGDGEPDSAEQNPVVTFSQPGTYTVTLAVAGPDGEDTRVSVGYITVELPSLAAIRVLPNQAVELELTGQAGRSYDIQVSGDLAAWTVLTNIVTTESVTRLVDPMAASPSARFYRAVVP